MPRRVARRYFFALDVGVRTPAGYGITRGSPCGHIGSKGANLYKREGWKAKLTRAEGQQPLHL